MARINVRLTEDLKRRLDLEAKIRGQTPSELVRQALEAHLKSTRAEETCLDIARRIGLVGCLKDAPPDLSTNRAYFEGFGRD
jgi:metal-responsive CopG/Arc/MetJ family transcriptional regulator